MLNNDNDNLWKSPQFRKVCLWTFVIGVPVMAGYYLLAERIFTP